MKEFFIIFQIQFLSNQSFSNLSKELLYQQAYCLRLAVDFIYFPTKNIQKITTDSLKAS